MREQTETQGGAAAVPTGGSLFLSSGYMAGEAAGSSVRWFALRVRPRHEKAVDTILGNKGYERFLPSYKCLRRRPDRYKEIEFPLFAGYLFCRFDPALRLPVLTTPGVLEIVGVGRIPAPVDRLELEAVERVLAAQAGVEPWPYLRCGDSVEIESGPLRGISGILLRTNGRSRLIVSVTLLQRSVAVEIDRSWVSPGRLPIHRLASNS